jgi:hypothetical protein
MPAAPAGSRDPPKREVRVPPLPPQSPSARHAAILYYRDGRRRPLTVKGPPPSAVVERVSVPSAGAGAAQLHGSRFRLSGPRPGGLAYVQEPGALGAASLRCTRCGRFAQVAFVQVTSVTGGHTAPGQVCERCYLG